MATDVASVPAPDPIQSALRGAVERMKEAPIARAAPGQTPAVALRQERDEIAAVYEERNFAPLWIEGGVFTAAARAAVARINLARGDGLDLTQYLPPTLDAVTPDAMARSEIALSQAAVGFARQASGVRVAPQPMQQTATYARSLASSESARRPRARRMRSSRSALRAATRSIARLRCSSLRSSAVVCLSSAA
jgi:hypothetical protein